MKDNLHASLSGLPPGPPSQLPRPTTMSAPNTPSIPSTTNIVPTCSLPTTPSGPATNNSVIAPPSSLVAEHMQTTSDQNRSPLSQGNIGMSYRPLLHSSGFLPALTCCRIARECIFTWKSVGRTYYAHARNTENDIYAFLTPRSSLYIAAHRGYNYVDHLIRFFLTARISMPLLTRFLDAVTLNNARPHSKYCFTFTINAETLIILLCYLYMDAAKSYSLMIQM